MEDRLRRTAADTADRLGRRDTSEVKKPAASSDERAEGTGTAANTADDAVERRA